MSFTTYCFRCDKNVTAHTLLDAAKLAAALKNDDDVKVMHISDNGDHRWKLSSQEKANLLNHIQETR